jgi:DNA-binding PadR family transcriptional regulator
VYPLLSILEAGNLIEGDWDDPDKRTRKIYQLTEDGRQELARLKEIMRPILEEAINVLQDLVNELDANQEDSI